MDDFTETYCLMDDFYKAFEPQLNARLLTDGKRHRSRKGSLSVPELMTLVVLLLTASSFRRNLASTVLLRSPQVGFFDFQ